MASELHVDAIKHSGGTSALTIDSSGNVHKAGFVLQVVQTAGSTGRQTYSSASFFDIVTVSITPKFSTSKILVSANTSITRTSSAYLNVQITRADSQIFSCDTQAAYLAGNSVEHSVGSVSGQILDSPSTTSATTYKLQAKVSGSGSLYVDGQPVITAMEIAQ